MKLVIQRVQHASCTVNGNVTGSINGGYLVLLGVGADDTEEICEKLAEKMIKLRIFADENGKTNRSLTDVGGGLLIISQFTLYADCSSGNRPFFGGGADPDTANRLYEHFVQHCKKFVPDVQTGIFGEEMKIDLLNDGPFTILLDESVLTKKTSK